MLPIDIRMALAARQGEATSMHHTLTNVASQLAEVEKELEKVVANLCSASKRREALGDGQGKRGRAGEGFGRWTEEEGKSR
jgi:hypothetical protein